MEKKFITIQDREEESWYKQARTQTLDTLPIFINHLLNDYSHDQQTIVEAIVAGTMATISAMNAHPEGGLVQSQTQALLGIFIRRWARIEGPAKIMSWAGLLDPRNEAQVMGVPKSVADWLRDLAVKALEKVQDETHRDHLKILVEGKMPWGLKVQQ